MQGPLHPPTARNKSKMAPKHTTHRTQTDIHHGRTRHIHMHHPLVHKYTFTPAHAHRHTEHTFVQSYRHTRMLIHTYSFTHATHTHHTMMFNFIYQHGLVMAPRCLVRLSSDCLSEGRVRVTLRGFPGDAGGKESACQCGR